MADLAEENWVIRLDHPVVEVLRRAAVAAGFEPKISFRANDYQEAQAMVLTTRGSSRSCSSPRTGRWSATR